MWLISKRFASLFLGGGRFGDGQHMAISLRKPKVLDQPQVKCLVSSAQYANWSFFQNLLPVFSHQVLMAEPALASLHHHLRVVDAL